MRSGAELEKSRRSGKSRGKRWAAMLPSDSSTPLSITGFFSPIDWAYYAPRIDR